MKTRILYSSLVLTSALAVVSGQAQNTNSDMIHYAPPGVAPLDIIVPEIPGDTGSQFVPAFAPATGFPDQAVFMYEDTALTRLSDAVWIQQGFLYFESDVNETLSHFPGAAVIPVIGSIVETGGLQDVGALFKMVTGAPFPPGVLFVASDVEVPEPSGLTMVGIGALVLGAFLRRSKV